MDKSLIFLTDPDFIYFESINSKPSCVFIVKDGIENKKRQAVSVSPEHAGNGLGFIAEKNKLQPYSDFLWEECEKWYSRSKKNRERIKKEYEALKEGQATFI